MNDELSKCLKDLNESSYRIKDLERENEKIKDENEKLKDENNALKEELDGLKNLLQ